MGSSAKFQYSALAPLAAETFQVQDAELVWSRTWLAPQQKAAVETVQTAPLEEATQQEPAAAPEPPQAGPPELGDFLALEEPAAPEPAPEAVSDDDKDELAPGQLAWDKASSRIRSPLLRLHSEIVNFCRALAPTPEEVEARHAAIARVTAHVCSIWPSAEVKVFGSVLTGLFVPSSDVDLVVINSGCLGSAAIRNALYKLSAAMRNKDAAYSIQVIAKAKVPIIKFKETASQFDFDISFEVADGPATGEFVAGLMARLPPMRPLILVLKIFLQQRDFNEVYKGGIGSYGLIVMVAAFLLLHPARAAQEGLQQGEACNLGELLLDFFRLYGRTLNTSAVGISCRDGGRFFAKLDRPDPFWQEDRPGMLAVEDPRDTGNDLGKGSYNYERKIRPALDFAYQQLSAPSGSDESILARIIRQDTILMGRGLAPPTEPEAAQPSRTRAHGGQSAQPPATGQKRRTSHEDRPAAKRARGGPAEAAGEQDRWELTQSSPHKASKRHRSGQHSPAADQSGRRHAAPGRVNGAMDLDTTGPRADYKHRRRRERSAEFDMPVGAPDNHHSKSGRQRWKDGHKHRHKGSRDRG